MTASQWNLVDQCYNMVYRFYHQMMENENGSVKCIPPAPTLTFKNRITSYPVAKGMNSVTIGLELVPGIVHRHIYL